MALRYGKVAGKVLAESMLVDLSPKTFKDLQMAKKEREFDKTDYTNEEIIASMITMNETKEDAPDDYDSRGYPKLTVLLALLVESTGKKAKLSAEERDTIWDTLNTSA